MNQLRGSSRHEFFVAVPVHPAGGGIGLDHLPAGDH